MPELPEVETTRKGIEPHLLHQKISNIIIRQKQLRWPIPLSIKSALKNQTITAIERRAKYLLIKSAAGTLIIHLGMSGSLRVLASNTPAQKHDHFEIQLSNGQCLRLRDPRRFGAVLWTDEDPLQHKLLINLGPEPLHEEFNATTIYQLSRNRKVSIKQFIMNANIVCGVGNIYASEALFLSGIHPKRQAGRVSLKRYAVLCKNIKTILKHSIKLGGTSLRDFTREDGSPGYFKQQLRVYGQANQPCPNCQQPIRCIARDNELVITVPIAKLR